MGLKTLRHSTLLCLENKDGSSKLNLILYLLRCSRQAIPLVVIFLGQNWDIILVLSAVAFSEWCGFDISMIDEPWIEMGLRAPPAAPDALSLQGYSVGHLIHQDTKTWNEEFVRFIFEAGTSQQILDTPLFLQVNEDKMVWKPEKNGQYSVRSAYRVCVEEIVVIEPLLHRFDDAPEIIFYLLEHGTTVQSELLVTIMWSIWKSRNNKLWQQVTESNGNIIERAKHLLEDRRNTKKKQQVQAYQQGNAAAVMKPIIQQVTAGRIEENRWKKPRCGRLKCNVDASFSSSTNKVGVGMCIRDEEGHFVRAKTMWHKPLCSVDIGEALGLHHDIGNGDITEFGINMDSNRHYCSLFLPKSHVEFSRRQANRVAHELAKAALYEPSFRIFDDVPTCIDDLISN
ncbi:hypothetical protein MTR_8g031080 [Medicago truncatula]|uniref:RNase H type-1 domain-containing protein n=1 Tax=Medicago truncatula TaxID=3880 RepID=A0A072TZD4_MEDTR|nr:hypothetical protein MTR_8g031080 [Medicago truncatula]